MHQYTLYKDNYSDITNIVMLSSF